MHARAFPGVELRQPFNSKTERICWHKALRAALAGNTLGPEEAKVLIYARETGAVDNTASAFSPVSIPWLASQCASPWRKLDHPRRMRA